MNSEPQQQRPQVLVVGPDGKAVDTTGSAEDSGERERPVTEMVEQPAKVMRIGSMIRQLLEEVRAAPLDEKSRARLKEIHESSIKELEDVIAPELVAELERLSLPFGRKTRRARPSCGWRRRSWSAGSRDSSTASRPRCSLSRWQPAQQLEQMRGREPEMRLDNKFLLVMVSSISVIASPVRKVRSRRRTRYGAANGRHSIWALAGPADGRRLHQPAASARARLAECLAAKLGLAVFATPLPLPPIEIAQLWHERVHSDQGHRWFRGTTTRSSARRSRNQFGEQVDGARRPGIGGKFQRTRILFTFAVTIGRRGAYSRSVRCAQPRAPARV